MIASTAVAAPYSGLYAYLKGRFADNLVLTFGQIEDLMGAPLPELARQHAEWWATVEGASKQSPQSGAWRHANRSATVNLFACTVLFQRDL